MTLLDIARRLGVETTTWCDGASFEAHPMFRPSLAIAMDVLQKLPIEAGRVSCEGSDPWCAARNGGGVLEILAVGTFEDAVVALATRFLEQQRAG